MAHRLAFVLQIDPGTFASHARELGWEPADGAGRGSAQDPRAQRWRVPGGEVDFVDDTVTEVQYVDVDADPPEPVEEAITKDLLCYDRDDCLEIFDLGAPEETTCHALRLLTVTAPAAFDQRVFDAAIEAMSDDRENVRVAAMMIANYTRWDEFLPEIDHLASDDPSPRVRGLASNHQFVLGLAAKSSR